MPSKLTPPSWACCSGRSSGLCPRHRPSREPANAMTTGTPVTSKHLFRYRSVLGRQYIMPFYCCHCVRNTAADCEIVRDNPSACKGSNGKQRAASKPHPAIGKQPTGLWPPQLAQHQRTLVASITSLTSKLLDIVGGCALGGFL